MLWPIHLVQERDDSTLGALNVNAATIGSVSLWWMGAEIPLEILITNWGPSTTFAPSVCRRCIREARVLSKSTYY